MANQVIPVSSLRRDRSNRPSPLSPIPDTAVSVLSISIRAGKRKHAIGFVQSLTFNVTREVEEYYEIVPYPPNDFGKLTSLFNNQSLNESIDFEGEPTLLIPGVQNPVTATLRRPMIYSANAMEALFKASGGGEFTTSEMEDVRATYREEQTSTLEDFGDAALRGVKGAAAGALVGAGRGDALGGAVAGGIQALLTSTQDPKKVRYGSLLQQVRPIDVSFIVFSPNANNQTSVVYALEFRNGWATSWSVEEVSVESQFVMETMEISFERLRVQTDY